MFRANLLTGRRHTDSAPVTTGSSIPSGGSTVAHLVTDQAAKAEELAQQQADAAEQAEKEQARLARQAERAASKAAHEQARAQYEDLTKAELADQLAERG